ncbi:hypothetical protein HHI36_017915 [Cryptolaemus montrouzieri]|uniref:Uncharacterized protein n=1 Tax=Cryptolaemus montrouzieri TaxID=559131 RepID=A0ABD2NYH7_9CUCU
MKPTTMSVKELESSPRKIRKLEMDSSVTRFPTHRTASMGIHEAQRSSQESQASRATSTPTKRYKGENISLSTEISSIQASPDVLSRRSISYANQSEDEVTNVSCLLEKISVQNVSSNSANRSMCSSKNADLLYNPNPKLFKGILWQNFKPKVESTLYFKICTNLRDIEEIAFDLVKEFEADNQKATLNLIKLFIDICGYHQSAKIEAHFDFSQDFSRSSEKVIKLMECDWIDENLLDSHTYIFYESDKGRSKLGAILEAAIRQFLQNFFNFAYDENILFTGFLYKRVFNFIFYMCQSNLRLIRHSGIVLVRMILTVLNTIYGRILNKMESEGHSEEIIEKDEEYIKLYLQYFFRIFAKNSHIPDPKLFILKAKNVEEMGIWMIDWPKVYFQNCFSILIKQVIDESEMVRLCTLGVYEKLISNRNIHLYITKNINNIILVVSDRLKDVSIKVVVKAVEIFTILLQHYRQFVQNEEDTIFEIMKLLYAESYLYAKAAGCFMSKFFELCNMDDTQTLRKLIDISEFPNYTKLKPLLVEAFSEHDTVLQDFDFLVNKLMDCQEDSNYAKNLMELIHYSVHQTLKGESAITRKHSIKVSPSPVDHEKIAKSFLLNLKDFLRIYENEIMVLNPLMKTLCLIDYNVLMSSYHAPEESQIPMDLHFKKIGKLYEKFNLNKYFDWPTLYVNWGGTLLCEGQIIACRQFLIWNITSLIRDSKKNTSSLRLAIICLQSNFSEFTKSLVQIMISEDSQDSMKYEAFESICVLYTAYEEILLKEEEFTEIIFNVKQDLHNVYRKPMEKFFESRIVNETSMPPEKKRKYICEWLSLILNGILDVLHATPLLKCYYALSKEYEAIIEFAYDKIFRNNSKLFFELILAALIEVAEGLFDTEGCTISSPEVRDLMHLAEKFTHLEQFQNTSEEVFTMINLGLKYVFKEKLFEFLVILQIFTAKLSEDHLNQCLQHFVNITPKI